jgi:hypothetical protein
MSPTHHALVSVATMAFLAAVLACGIDARDVKSLSASSGTNDAAGGVASSGGAAGDAPGGSGGNTPVTMTEQGGGASIPLAALGGSRGEAPRAGSAGEGGEPDAGGSEPESEPEPEPEPGDTTPPSVLSVTPADGTSQVISELISIQFSEPMNQASVEAGFSEGTGYAWSADGTTVTFQLPLPFDAEPRLFDIIVPSSVNDLAGNPLGSNEETSIELAALARVTLPFDGTLSGNQIAGQNGNFTFFELGDTASDLVRYAAASFALEGLPAFEDVRALRQATLHLQVSDAAGNPSDPAFDGFLIDRVSFTARADIDNPTVIEPAFTRLLVPAAVVPGRLVRLDVAPQLRTIWSAGETHLQLRFGPPASNLDAVADTLFLRRVADENNAVVDEAALLEPDPGNVARIELEYFP